MHQSIPRTDQTPDAGEHRRDRSCAGSRAKNPRLALAIQATLLRRLFDSGEATTDDLLPHVAIPKGVDPRVIGSSIRPLIDDGVIRSVGRAKSRRPEAHSRSLDVWAIADPAAALRVLTRFAAARAEGGAA